MKGKMDLINLNVIIEDFNDSILDALVGGNDPISCHNDPTHGGTNVGGSSGADACACACGCWPDEP